MTGHVPGADPDDNLAVFRAFGPDRPDPPPGNGGGGGGSGGGGGGSSGGSGGSGGGGGAPPPGPGGAGQEAPLPPHVDNKLYGQSPDIFTGDKQKAREFITQWDLYWSLNFNAAMMKTPYTRAMLFLIFFKGPLTANWTSVMNRHLNTQVRSGVPVNDEALWDHVYDSFRRQYADMQERERAEDMLQRGISMRPGEPDTYIAEYEVLVEMAGYNPNR